MADGGARQRLFQQRSVQPTPAPPTATRTATAATAAAATTATTRQHGGGDE
ncbi:MAG TPA: hypothetical protein VMK53_04255 [Gemmatimonadales bacterium]|nr:hypothetical protein [Gemmatimonadales bacterium]